MRSAILWGMALLLVHAAPAQQQKRIQILSSKNTLVERVDGRQLYYLSGRVGLQQDDATMYCDSAVLAQPENTFDAFGHVRIVQSDTTTVVGERLHYDGSKRTFKIEQNVVLSTPSSRLETVSLEFDRTAQTGRYTTRSTLYRNEMRITADRGSYAVRGDRVLMSGQVVAVDTAFELRTDTLIFYPRKNKYQFVGGSTLLKDSATILCALGSYNHSTNELNLGSGATISEPGKYIDADSISYNLKSSRGELFGQALVADSSSGFVLESDYIYYVEDPNYVDAYAPIFYRQHMDGDTLYVRSDSLSIRSDSAGLRRVQTRFNTSFYTRDVQAISPHFRYDETLEKVFLYPMATIWSEQAQLQGDSTYITLKDEHIDSLYLLDNVKMLNTTKDSVHFDQAVGKRLLGNFEQDSLHDVLLEGNAESRLFLISDEGTVQGLNQSASSWISMLFLGGEVNNIVAGRDVQAKYLPWGMTAESDRVLQGCQPKFEMRPTKESVQNGVKNANAAPLEGAPATTKADLAE